MPAFAVAQGDSSHAEEEVGAEVGKCTKVPDEETKENVRHGRYILLPWTCIWQCLPEHKKDPFW